MVEQLGTARKATVAATSTTLIADAASRDEIEMRIAQLKKELAETDSGGGSRAAIVPGLGGLFLGWWRWECGLKKELAETDPGGGVWGLGGGPCFGVFSGLGLVVLLRWGSVSGR